MIDSAWFMHRANKVGLVFGIVIMSAAETGAEGRELANKGKKEGPSVRERKKGHQLVVHV